MLFIVMHKREDYLKEIATIMKEEGITDTSLIKKEGLGLLLLGEGRYSFGLGVLKEEYDKALICVIRDKDKVKRILSLIEKEPRIRLLNLQDKGFACAIPFARLTGLEIELAKKEEKGAIRLSGYLRKELIKLDLGATVKKEAIEELGAVIKGAKEVTDYESFLKGVFEREALTTTGIGNGIAIPHARTDTISQFVIAFGRSEKGVEFESLDGQPAKLIFLMGTPTKEINQYLKLLARLTSLLKRESFRESLLQAGEAKEIIEIFEETEK